MLLDPKPPNPLEGVEVEYELDGKEGDEKDCEKTPGLDPGNPEGPFLPLE